MSTIFALSSGNVKCGVAVIRISGPNSKSVISNMTNIKLDSLKPRFAYLRTIVDPVYCEHLDKGLVLWFPGPNSYTGEDCCELHVHGGKAVVSAIFNALSKLKNFRPAESGEFTKRAFCAGKLDLTEIEGLSDLIDAETEVQRKQAILQAEGILSNLYQDWRKIIVQSLAYVESAIDFGEEEISEDTISHATANVQQLQQMIQNFLSSSKRGERLKDGVKTVIVGSPNVGKSSLFNILCGRSAAIVTEMPGTTRDVLETHLDIAGYSVLLIDTAGIRDQVSDIVERHGVNRAHRQALLADILLIVIDSRCYLYWYEKFSRQLSLNEYLKYYVNTLQLNTVVRSDNSIVVLNKCDDLTEDISKILSKESENFITMSCKTKDGISSLVELLSKRLEIICGNPSVDGPLCSQIRHGYHLNECSSLLTSYLDTMRNEENLVIAAEKLRLAARHIGEVTGSIATEEILDNIFKQFCIGK